MKIATTPKRRTAVIMITVVAYNPTLQEYMLLPMPTRSISAIRQTLAAQYSSEEQQELHIVTVLEGVCVASAAYENEVSKGESNAT